MLKQKQNSEFLPKRLVFRNPGEAAREYDYAQLNQGVNKDEQVRTGDITIAREAYTPGIGISYNLQNALREKLEKQEARKFTFEMLHAIDEFLLEGGEVSPGETGTYGIDRLDVWLKGQGASTFEIEEGFLTIYNAAGDAIIKLPLISSRQPELVAAFYEKEEEVLDDSGGSLGELRQNVASQFPTMDAAGPADDSLAISAAPPHAPQQGGQFAVPREFWIGQGDPPRVLDAKWSARFVCMAYVGEILEREVGDYRLLKYLGYRKGSDAWELKRDLLQLQESREGEVFEGAEVFSIGADHLAIEGKIDLEKLKTLSATGLTPAAIRAIQRDSYNGRSRIVEQNMDSYPENLFDFRGQLDQMASTGSPVIMGLCYRYSEYHGQVIEHNALLAAHGAPEEQHSFNTHVAILRGKEFRAVEGSPQQGESPQEYLTRVLKIKPNYEFLFNDVRVRVSGELCEYHGGAFISDSTSEPVELTPQDTVELEDYYFAHHFHGSEVESYLELLGAGRFLATDLMRLRTEELNEEEVAKAPEEDALQPVAVLYLRKNETIRKAFLARVSSEPDDWYTFKLYLQFINFDTRRVRVYNEPIPIPDFEAVRAHIESTGGLAAIEYTETKRNCDYYNERHPGEYFVAIAPGSNPWEAIYANEKIGIGRHFTDVEPLTRAEREYVLGEVDRLNPSIDLRPVRKLVGGEEKVVLGSWEAGSYFWVSDEMAEAISHNIEVRRVQAQVYVPGTISAAHERFGEIEASITPEERTLIESATNDPELRLLLTLVLVNEQKCTYLGLRNKKARFGEEVLGRKEQSVGLFQVDPTAEDAVRYGYADRESLRLALLDDPELNIQVAIDRLREDMQSYRYYLDLNGEPVSMDLNEDEYLHFVRGVLSCYNRRRSDVYAGMLELMAQNVCEEFILVDDDGNELEYGMFHADYAHLYSAEQRAYGGTDDDFAGDTGGGMDIGAISEEDIPPITGRRVAGKGHQEQADFWHATIESMVRDGYMVLTPEQINQDLERYRQNLLRKAAAREGRPDEAAEIMDLATAVEGLISDPDSDLSQKLTLVTNLIVEDKSLFLQTNTYQMVKHTYEASSGGRLSLMMTSEDDYFDTAIQNYGFRATRYGQLGQIEIHSMGRRQRELATTLNPPHEIHLASLRSVQHMLPPETLEQSLAEIGEELEHPIHVPIQRKERKSHSSSNPQMLKDWAYVKFGSELYQEYMEYPIPHAAVCAEKLATSPSTLPLRPDAYPNHGASETNWVGIPMRQGGTYWRAEYHLSDLDIAGLAYSEHPLEDFGPDYDEEKRNVAWERAKVHIVSFPSDSFQFTYRPGSTLLQQSSDGEQVGFLTADNRVTNPAIGIIDSSHTSLNSTSEEDIIGIFNGTFHQEDTSFVIGGVREYAGLVVDGTEVIPPSSEMATFAVYRDGEVRLGTYRNLPDKENIVTLRQNNFMVMEDGDLNPTMTDPEEWAWNRYGDDILGSYLATNEEGQMAYIWSTYAPPWAVAETLKAAGFTNVMLLDIHPVVSASVAQAGYGHGDGVINGHYDVVPQLETPGVRDKQWDPRIAVGSGSPHDFFAVVARDERVAEGPTEDLAEDLPPVGDASAAGEDSGAPEKI